MMIGAVEDVQLTACHFKQAYSITSNLVWLLIYYGFSAQILNLHLVYTYQRRQQKTALENSNASIYFDFHYVYQVDLKSQSPRNSKLVRKNHKINHFSSRTKLEAKRYY